MTAALSSETVHATCVAIGDHAVLIEGRSGAGKSDLALRLIDRGARLVSDDYTLVMRDREGRLHARPPFNLAGRMEIRGIGIVEMDHVADIAVALMVVIVETPERLPEARALRHIAGIGVAEIALASLEPSAPIKVEMALARTIAAAG
jgi:serine kinase of HPr protein (carbohydrate metabolism regulator)